MTEPARLMLTTNVAAVPGVGDRHADAFRHLGMRCVADLVLHLLMRYEHELAEQTIAEMTKQAKAVGGGDLTLSVCGEIVSVRSVPGRRRRRVEATVQDDTGAIRVIWFNMPWLADKLRPGLTVRVTGRAAQHRDLLQMVNPRWEVVDAAASTPAKRPERYRPVYPASDDLPSWQIERAVGEVLDGVLADLDDHLHEQYRASRAIPGLAEAYRMMHRPADADEPPRARRRLALDELLLLQLGVMLKRRHRRRTLRAPAMKHSKAIDRHIVAVHRTYLHINGHDKAEVTVPRMALGSLKGGAVRLAKAEDHVALVEGIEDGLAFMQMADTPAWAMLGTSGYRNVVLPRHVERVTLAPDNDDAGRAVLEEAGNRLADARKDVRVLIPPDGVKDWADLLPAIEERAAVAAIDGDMPVPEADDQ